MQNIPGYWYFITFKIKLCNSNSLHSNLQNAKAKHNDNLKCKYICNDDFRKKMNGLKQAYMVSKYLFCFCGKLWFGHALKSQLLKCKHQIKLKKLHYYLNPYKK